MSFGSEDYESTELSSDDELLDEIDSRDEIELDVPIEIKMEREKCECNYGNELIPNPCTCITYHELDYQTRFLLQKLIDKNKDYVWEPYDDAPNTLQHICHQGGDEDRLAFVVDYMRTYKYENSKFGCCEVRTYILSDVDDHVFGYLIVGTHS